MLEEFQDGLPVAREIIQIKASEVIASVKIPRQDFRAFNDWDSNISCGGRRGHGGGGDYDKHA